MSRRNWTWSNDARPVTPEAFDQLLTRYRTRVFAMIYNMVHNEQDAWDLAQDSFVKAWKSIGRFRGKSSFYTWIYRIVMNVTIDWLQKRQNQGRRSGVRRFDSAQRNRTRLEDGTPKADPLPPHQRMERGSEIRARSNKAIAQLSPDHRAVILMKEIEEMQYHADLRDLGCSIGTVMSRLFLCPQRSYKIPAEGRL